VLPHHGQYGNLKGEPQRPAPGFNLKFTGIFRLGGVNLKFHCSDYQRAPESPAAPGRPAAGSELEAHWQCYSGCIWQWHWQSHATCSHRAELEVKVPVPVTVPVALAAIPSLSLKLESTFYSRRRAWRVPVTRTTSNMRYCLG